MIPAQIDIEVFSAAAPLIWERGFLLTPDQPYDFTGHTARLQIRRFPGAPDALASLTDVTTTAQGIRFYKIRDDAVLDGLRIKINQSTLSSLPGLALLKTGERKEFAYDLLINAPGRDEQLWLFGALKVARGVTRT